MKPLKLIKNLYLSLTKLLRLKSFCLLPLACCLLAFTNSTTATIRYVSHEGSNTPPYTSWETAADSIMSAINISEFGDTIYVASGVYEEQVIMIPGLTLIGSGMDSTIIDTRSLVTSTEFKAVTMADSCIINGFYILISNNNIGIGIEVRDSDTKISNNKISNAGWGVYSFNSNSTLINNQILEVSLRGIEIEAFNYNYHPQIENNLISTEQFGILIFFGTKPTIRNNIIFLTADFAHGYTGGGSDTSWVYNNLIIAQGDFGHTRGLNNSIRPTFTINNFLIGSFGFKGINAENLNIIKNNNIMNSPKGIIQEPGDNPIIKYNNSWNNGVNYGGFTPDSTNLSVDPMVVSEDSLDFHLQMYSPLIDAGDPNILDVDSTRSDIGLYGGPFGESYVYIDLAPKPPRNLTAVVDSPHIAITWNKNTEADFNSYNLFRDTTANFTADSTTLVANLTVNNYLQIIPPGVNAYYYKLTAIDNQGNESEPSEELAVIITTIKEYPKTVSDYRLYQNYPNPFNPTTKIGYKLKERGYVKLYVYDIKGELVAVLVNQFQDAGYYEVEFNGNAGANSGSPVNLASGIYIYQIMVKNENNIPVFSDIKKMLLVK